MNKVQKLECMIINYAQTIGGLLVISNKDYRQLRKGIRLTYRMQSNGLSYYDWLCNEQLVWRGIEYKRNQAESTLADDTDVEEVM